MNTHLSSETDDAAKLSILAVNSKHEPPPASSPTNSLGDFAAIIALSIAFCTLLLINTQTTVAPATVVQTFELPPRPLWISNLPYGPVDGQIPDFGQPQTLHTRLAK